MDKTKAFFDSYGSRLAMKLPKTLNVFKVLVCGRTGVGKSTLINSLVGRRVCDVGDPGGQLMSAGHDAFDPRTKEVHPFFMEQNGILLKIYDSPGLIDGTEHESEYLEEMKKHCADADLVLFCMEMTTNWTPQESQTIEKLTKTFTIDFWSKVVFVMTKANTIEEADMDMETELGEVSTEARLKTIRKSHMALLGKRIRDLGPKSVETEKIIESIPGVLAGNLRKREINGVDFISELWVSCLERIGVEKHDDFCQVTNIHNRLIDSDDESDEVESAESDTVEQAIPVAKTSTNTKAAITNCGSGRTAAPHVISIKLSDSRNEFKPPLATNVRTVTLGGADKFKPPLTTNMTAVTSDKPKPKPDPLPTKSVAAQGASDVEDYRVKFTPEQKERIVALSTKRGAKAGAVVGAVAIPVVGAVPGAILGAAIGGFVGLCKKLRRKKKK